MKTYEFRNGAGRASSTAAVTLPSLCPSCQSRSISTTARNPDENTYWRCGTCGEIWNACRRKAGSSGGRRW